MSSLVRHSTSHKASGRVNAGMPRNAGMLSASVLSHLHRTDLLDSLLVVTAARHVMPAALERKAARSTTANGGSIWAVAALSLRRSSAWAARITAALRLSARRIRRRRAVLAAAGHRSRA